MFGGEKDYNYKKGMPPIVSLVFAMKKEKDEKIEQYNFVQQTIKANKEMVRKGKVALASYVLGEGETTNPHIKVPDVSQRSSRLSSFTISKASSNIVIHPTEDSAYRCKISIIY